MDRASRLGWDESKLFTRGDKADKKVNITGAAADTDFLPMFGFPMIEGDARTALRDPNNIVLTQKAARTLFGNEDPMGKILAFKTYNVTKKVTGIIKRIPSNSHFHFDFFASLADVAQAKSASFLNGSFYTYLVLPKGYDYNKLQAK